MDPRTWSSILTFLSGGVIGGFIGGATKFFWEKYLPDRLTWRRDQKIERDKLLSQYGGPGVRAIHELQQRIYVLVFKNPRKFAELKPEEAQYETESLAFLVAQCCARLEILRGKMETVDYAKLIDKLDPVSRNLAGYGRKLPLQLHRLQQQEIAELMLAVREQGELYCIGYSKFLVTLRRKKALDCWSGLACWTRSILDCWPDEVVRLVEIQRSLVDALDFLDGKRRWIPDDKRKRLDGEAVIENLRRVDLIDEKKAKTLSEELQTFRQNTKPPLPANSWLRHNLRLLFGSSERSS